MERCTFNKVQKASLSLIRNDLRFLYTLIANRDKLQNNYLASALPYVALIVDGTEKWINRYNNSSKSKIAAPTFSEKEKEFYAKMRSSLKLWDANYRQVYDCLEALYKKSDLYFSSICKPIGRWLHLYDIYGVDIANNEYCGNTILCSYYYPDYSYNSMPLEESEKLFEIGGKYIGVFSADAAFPVREDIHFTYKDFGGIIKSPVGNKFSDKFVLFSILCQVEFILICIDQWITEEVSTKLRCSYLLYYYLTVRVPEMNKRFGTDFYMSDKYASVLLRNAMAHYGLGVVLKQEDLRMNDLMFGLSQKVLGEDYYSLKRNVLKNLNDFASQIKEYIGLI